jgi:hypothetical protein
MTSLTLVGAVAVMAAGCGGTARAAPTPPNPATLAKRLGCTVDNWTDTPSVAAYDVLKAIDTTCPGYGQGDEIMTFSSAAKQTDWLHQNQVANTGAAGDGYPAVVDGHLWIVYPSDAVAGTSAVIAAIGGREVDF